MGKIREKRRLIKPEDKNEWWGGGATYDPALDDVIYTPSEKDTLSLEIISKIDLKSIKTEKPQ